MNAGGFEILQPDNRIVEKCAAGEEIVITRHGAPVAKLVPVKKEASTEERAAAIKRIQKLGTRLSLTGLRVKELIAEGRR